MVARLGVSVRTVACALPVLLAACISTTPEDSPSGGGTSGASWTGGDHWTGGTSGTSGTGGTSGTSGTGGTSGTSGAGGTSGTGGTGGTSGTGGTGGVNTGGYGNVGATTYGDRCFNAYSCCSGWNVTVIDETCVPRVLACEFGCNPNQPCTSVSFAANLCRGRYPCGHHFDCIALEGAVGEKLECDTIRGACVGTMPATTERPSDLGGSCMLSDEGTFFTDPNAIETYVVRASGCETGVCVLDEADTLGVPQRCTYRCQPGVTDCGTGYECRELPARGEIGDPFSVAVCVGTLPT